MEAFLMFLMTVVALFLIIIVLIQRGKGGGLAGAFGGQGGHSAFGTKAASNVTWITYGVAAFWIVTCMFSIKWVTASAEDELGSDLGSKAEKPASSTLDPEKPATDAGKTGDAKTESGKTDDKSAKGEAGKTGSTPPGEVTEKEVKSEETTPAKKSEP